MSMTEKLSARWSTENWFSFPPRIRFRSNRRRRLLHVLAVHAAAVSLVVSGAPLRAATVYWDINGTTAGASNAQSAAGTWDGANTFFNSDSTGGSGGTVAAWTPGDILALGAGGTATGNYTITVSGTQQIGGLIFEEGQVTLAGGTLEMTANSVCVAANTPWRGR